MIIMENTKEKEYTEEDIKNCIKPLSENAFIRFFQNIGRRWLAVWYGFAERRPRLSDWLYKIGFFCLFSFSVTVYQFIIMTFLPYAFASMNNGPVGWPMIPISAAGGRYFTIFGDETGWGYFIAFEIAVFTAQCINFPLQRNVTYKSHGNPWIQAAWYFFGWVVVSVATNSLWGLCNAFLLHWGCPYVLTGLIKTVLTGGVSMVVFFFIFLIIFPDAEKAAKRAEKNYDKLVSKNAPWERIEKAAKKKDLWRGKADGYNAEKELSRAKSLANACGIKYFACKQKFERAEADRDKLDTAFANAVEVAKRLDSLKD